MSVHDDSTRLGHMLLAANKVVAWSKGKTRETLDEDEQFVYSIIRALEIIGEAASQVSREFQNQHPQIRWAEIIGMRNRIVHAYFDINLDIVWATITVAVPELITELEKLIPPDEPLK